MIEFKDLNQELKGIDEKNRTVEFYASTWDVDQVNDQIKRGAYTKTISERGPQGKGDIRHLYQHSGFDPIGRIEEMYEDEKGLVVRSYISKAEEGHLIKYKEGIHNRHSIGFNVIDAEKEGNLRIIKEIKLHEVNTVTFPANEMAGMKSLDLEELDRIKNLAEGNKDLILYIEHLKALAIKGPETPQENEPTLAEYFNLLTTLNKD